MGKKDKFAISDDKYFKLSLDKKNVEGSTSIKDLKAIFKDLDSKNGTKIMEHLPYVTLKEMDLIHKTLSEDFLDEETGEPVIFTGVYLMKLDEESGKAFEYFDASPIAMSQEMTVLEQIEKNIKSEDFASNNDFSEADFTEEVVQNNIESLEKSYAKYSPQEASEDSSEDIEEPVDEESPADAEEESDASDATLQEQSTGVDEGVDVQEDIQKPESEEEAVVKVIDSYQEPESLNLPPEEEPVDLPTEEIYSEPELNVYSQSFVVDPLKEFVMDAPQVNFQGFDVNQDMGINEQQKRKELNGLINDSNLRVNAELSQETSKKQDEILDIVNAKVAGLPTWQVAEDKIVSANETLKLSEIDTQTTKAIKDIENQRAVDIDQENQRHDQEILAINTNADNLISQSKATIKEQIDQKYKDIIASQISVEKEKYDTELAAFKQTLLDDLSPKAMKQLNALKDNYEREFFNTRAGYIADLQKVASEDQLALTSKANQVLTKQNQEFVDQIHELLKKASVNSSGNVPVHAANLAVDQSQMIEELITQVSNLAAINEVQSNKIKKTKKIGGAAVAVLAALTLGGGIAALTTSASASDQANTKIVKIQKDISQMEKNNVKLTKDTLDFQQIMSDQMSFLNQVNGVNSFPVLSLPTTSALGGK